MSEAVTVVVARGSTLGAASLVLASVVETEEPLSVVETACVSV